MKKLEQKLKEFKSDQRGNFAMMFGLCTTVLVGGLAVAIDISSISSKKQKYQDLSDSAVLAAAISGKQTQAELQLIAEKTVFTNYGSEDINVNLTILPDNTIRVVVSKEMDDLFMPHSEASKMISALSEAPPKGNSKMNIALVLDVTDSMEGAKLESLKNAADNFIDIFEDDGDDDDGDDDDGDDGDGGGEGSLESIRMSVVPFARYVKLPTSMEGKPWLHVEAPNENCWNKLDLEASEAAGTCTLKTTEGGGWNCTAPVYYEHCQIIEWNGCVTSRHFPWNKRAQYGPHKIPGFAGGGGCGSKLLPLTGDIDDVSESIDDLYTYGQTYIPSGLIWGWRSLTPEYPLDQANTPDQAERKNVMILMTDGENSRSYGGEKENGFPGVFHWESDLNDANSLTAELCEEIKQDDIEIYTIAFEVDDAATESMLTACATDPGKYFDASNTEQLYSAFDTIGLELAAVRLSR